MANRRRLAVLPVRVLPVRVLRMGALLEVRVLVRALRVGALPVVRVLVRVLRVRAARAVAAVKRAPPAALVQVAKLAAAVLERTAVQVEAPRLIAQLVPS